MKKENMVKYNKWSSPTKDESSSKRRSRNLKLHLVMALMVFQLFCTYLILSMDKTSYAHREQEHKLQFTDYNIMQSSNEDKTSEKNHFSTNEKNLVPSIKDVEKSTGNLALTKIKNTKTKEGDYENINVFPTSSPYAYSWLIGGIHEDRHSYKGFLYSVLISVNMLRRKGSTADFVLWAQLSPDSKLSNRLPDEDERLLSEAGVRVRMLDPVDKDSFAQIVYEKFRTLTMTEYERVIFLDADIMVRSNLDYWFHLSKEGLIRPNLVMASGAEPCNTSFFMVTPSQSGWKTLLNIIDRQHKEGLKLPYPHWTNSQGWGINLKHVNMPAEAINRKAYSWHWHASFSDQGLFYYYAKFGIQDTSIIIGKKLQNWEPGDNELPVMTFEGEFLKEVESRDLSTMLPPKEPRIEYRCEETPFHCDDLPYHNMVHFAGKNKPWQHKLSIKRKAGWRSIANVWFNELDQLNNKYSMGLDVKNWGDNHQEHIGQSTFGYMAKFWDYSEMVKSKNDTTVTEREVNDLQSTDVAVANHNSNNTTRITNKNFEYSNKNSNEGETRKKNFSTKEKNLGPSIKDIEKSSGTLALTKIKNTKNKEGDNKNINVSPTSSPYAYSWLIGGIHEDRHSYKGFIYSVLISVNILRRKGSTADFVLWAQLSPDSKLSNRLPDEDERLLREAGVRLRMLDPVEKDSFAQIVYEKFRTLTMTEYERVIFLDADIMVRSNLDYWFHLSKEGLIRPNLVMASGAEPCNTSFFMVTPSQSGWKKLLNIIDMQHKEGLKYPYPHFTKFKGWGINMRKYNMPWEAINQKGLSWDWYASFSDQGLFYYYAKFGIQDTSIIIGKKLQNWEPGDNELPVMTFEGEFLKEVESRDLSTMLPPKEPRIEYRCTKTPFHCDDLPYHNMVHFAGNFKPWQHKLSSLRKKGWRSIANVWFNELDQLNDKYGMGLDVKNWGESHQEHIGQSTFGYMAQFSEHAEMVKSKNVTTATVREVNDLQSTGVAVANQNSNNTTTIAYVVSFIQCENFQTNSAGLVDASLVLRHSIHKNSVRNPASGSKYDYKMYAIVHRSAESCSEALTHAGFEVMVVDPPVKKSEIRGDFLRKHIHREVCCGHDEFVKLYVYNKIPEEIFVHLDIDFALYKPMDHLFDAMIYDKDSEEGKKARSLIERERATDKWPDRIDAFITRDWPQVAPGKFPPGYQAGFIVGRHDPEVFDEIVEVIREGNYTDGWGYKYGWGSKGYGGFVGAQAMQGLMAYYYDIIRPNTSVELNHCRHNHMGMDVRYNKPPNFATRFGKRGQCRNNNPDDVCEDCMVTEKEKIYSIHYTMCRKPWTCIGTGYPGGKKPGNGRASAIDTDMVHLDHCTMLARMWHELRADMENQLFNLTGDTAIKEAQTGNYKPDVFLGHCTEDMNDGYLKLSLKEETYNRFSELYGY